jgi:hypothetical protein
MGELRALPLVLSVVAHILMAATLLGVLGSRDVHERPSAPPLRVVLAPDAVFLSTGEARASAPDETLQASRPDVAPIGQAEPSEITLAIASQGALVSDPVPAYQAAPDALAITGAVQLQATPGPDEAAKIGSIDRELASAVSDNLLDVGPTTTQPSPPEPQALSKPGLEAAAAGIAPIAPAVAVASGPDEPTVHVNSPGSTEDLVASIGGIADLVDKGPPAFAESKEESQIAALPDVQRPPLSDADGLAPGKSVAPLPVLVVPPQFEDRRAEPPTDRPPAVGPQPIGVDRVDRYVRQFDGGHCFFLMPTKVTVASASVEGFGSNRASFTAFDADFKRDMGFEALVELREVTPAQCPAIDFMRSIAEVSRPELKIDVYTVKNGQALTGSVENLGGRNVEILLVAEDGTVRTIPSIAGSGPQSRAFLAPQRRLKGDGTVPRLVMAVASDRPVRSLRIDRPVSADSAFAAVQAEMAESGSRLSVAAKYFKVTE